MKTRITRRGFTAGVAAAAIIAQAGLSKPARAAVRIRHAGSGNAQYHGNATMQRFWGEVAKRSNGEIAVETHWGTLGGEQALMQAVTLGTLEGYQGAYTGMREFDVFYTAHLFRDYEHATKVINGPLRPALTQAIEKKYDVQLIGLGRAGSFGLQTKEKISSWADLKNKKIRTGPIEGVLESVKALGANAVSIAFNEVYTALQQGVVDGQVNLNTLILTQKYYEVIKYWVRGDFGLGFDKVVVSKRAWNQISPANQKMILDYFIEWEAKEWWPPVRAQLEADYKKWEEFAGAGTVISLNVDEARKMLEPTGRKLVEEIFGAGTYAKFQSA